MKVLVAAVMFLVLAGAPALACQPHELKAGADCSGANLEGVNLVELAEAGVISWYLEDINLEGAKLREANLQYFDMTGASLKNADIEYADLSYTTLDDTDLRSANLFYTKLQRASLVEADLRDADLKWASIGGAIFWGADLRGARVSAVDQSVVYGQGFHIWAPASFEGAVLFDE